MNANANASFFGNLRGKTGPTKEPAAGKAAGRGGAKASIPVFEDKVVCCRECDRCAALLLPVSFVRLPAPSSGR